MEKKNEKAIAKYLFTDEEKIEKGIELTEQMSKKRGFEAVVRLNKSLIKKTESDIAVLEAKVSNGFEFREYMCDVILDFETKKRLYRSLETGEIIKEAPLEANDYQLKMLEDEKIEKTKKRDDLFAKNGVALTEEGAVLPDGDFVPLVKTVTVQGNFTSTQVVDNSGTEEEQKQRKKIEEENFDKWEAGERAKVDNKTN